MTVPITRYAWLSIATAVLTLSLKVWAYYLTDSVGMLSDAMESAAVVAAMMALTMLTIAVRPADDDHAFGHSKAEYFASGFEGALIVAAISNIWAAWPRLLQPQAIEPLNLGFRGLLY